MAAEWVQLATVVFPSLRAFGLGPVRGEFRHHLPISTRVPELRKIAKSATNSPGKHLNGITPLSVETSKQPLSDQYAF